MVFEMLVWKIYMLSGVVWQAFKPTEKVCHLSWSVFKSQYEILLHSYFYGMNLVGFLLLASIIFDFYAEFGCVVWMAMYVSVV